MSGSTSVRKGTGAKLQTGEGRENDQWKSVQPGESTDLNKPAKQRCEADRGGKGGADWGLGCRRRHPSALPWLNAVPHGTVPQGREPPGSNRWSQQVESHRCSQGRPGI